MKPDDLHDAQQDGPFDTAIRAYVRRPYAVRIHNAYCYGLLTEWERWWRVWLRFWRWS